MLDFNFLAPLPWGVRLHRGTNKYSLCTQCSTLIITPPLPWGVRLNRSTNEYCLCTQCLTLFLAPPLPIPRGVRLDRRKMSTAFALNGDPPALGAVLAEAPLDPEVSRLPAH